MIRLYALRTSACAALSAMGLAAWAVSLPVEDWRIAGPFGGTATSITLDPENPKIVLAGARNSLLFQSQDAGATWNQLNFPKRNFGEVTSILVDPSDSKHYIAGMIAAEWAGLFETEDCGKTWTPVKDVQDVGVRALAASASKPSRFVAGTLSGVMLSDDSGKTWTRISDSQNLEMQGITAIAIDPKDPNIIYAGTPHLPWRTMDGGKTWESIHTGMIDDSDVFSIYVNSAMPNDVFASACSGIYESTNRGDGWRKLLGIPNTSRRTHVVRFQDECCGSSSHAGAIFAGTTMGFFKSSNGGTSWKLVNGSQVNAIAADPSHPGGMYLAMEYDGVGKTDDNGETIHAFDHGFVDRDISGVTASGGNFFAVETQEGETSGLFTSSDQGETWSRLQPRGLTGVHLRSITGLPGQAHLLIAASPHQMYKSIDSGVTWKPLSIRLVTPPPVAASKPVTRNSAQRSRRASRSARPIKPKVTFKEISPSEISGLYSVKGSTTDLLFAATDLGLLKSSDLGEYWTLADLPGSTPVYALYVAPISDGRVVARASGGLYQTKDFGDHWQQLYFPLPESEVNEVALPQDSSAALLVGTRTGLYRSHDNGTTWSPNSGKLPASTVSSVTYSPKQPGLAYAVEYGQLYETEDFGNSWILISTALPGLHIRQLWIPGESSDRLYGITNDLGILFRK